MQLVARWCGYYRGLGRYYRSSGWLEQSAGPPFITAEMGTFITQQQYSYVGMQRTNGNSG